MDETLGLHAAVGPSDSDAQGERSLPGLGRLNDDGKPSDPGGTGAGIGRCRLFHRWDTRTWVDTTPYSISPRAGVRSCGRCGKRQRYFYDSQGGSWEDDRG